ncbi:hypothetical protein [Caballeronia sp. ATUFL_M2_KS44]|uniref:hypothetical protein n=1 Tax=Caballeronia sp. ATUFL_M2_KS44 TaxID=2921767 RepID=UPI002028FD38|nr:hypothetical protein [Caballeronia sp. ATUFL_M2_KS44]
MKRFNALANREFLLLVAIVASAVTLHVRERAIETPVASQASYPHMCEPTGAAGNKAKILPAGCDVRTDTKKDRNARPWV